MKKTIAIAVLAGTALSPSPLTTPAFAQSRTAAGAASGATTTNTVKKLTRAELDALLSQPDRTLVLDVRRPDELQSIGGFPAYLSIQAGELEKYLRVIPKDRQIVTVSNHASRATKAADLLQKNGFTVAGAVGAQDYESEGGTLVKIAAPAPKAEGR